MENNMSEKAIAINDRKEQKLKGIPRNICSPNTPLNRLFTGIEEIDLVLRGKIVQPPKIKMADKIQYHVYYAMGAYMETPLENLVYTEENNFDNFGDALHILKIKLSNMNIPFNFTSELKEDVLYRHCDVNLTARLLITTKTLEEANRLLYKGAK